MEDPNSLFSFIFMALILLAIFALCAYVIKRCWIDRKWFGSGSQFIGRHVYTQFQNADKRQAVEHIIFVEEDEREEASGGEGLKPDPKPGDLDK